MISKVIKYYKEHPNRLYVTAGAMTIGYLGQVYFQYWLYTNRLKPYANLVCENDQKRLDKFLKKNYIFAKYVSFAKWIGSKFVDMDVNVNV